MKRDTITRSHIDACLRSALHYLERAHGRITPETHGENYYPVINDVEDVLEKVRGAISA